MRGRAAPGGARGILEVSLPGVPLRCTHPSKRKNGVRWGPRYAGLKAMTPSPHVDRKTGDRRKRGRGLRKLSQMRYLPTVVLTARRPTESLLPRRHQQHGSLWGFESKVKIPTQPKPASTPTSAKTALAGDPGLDGAPSDVFSDLGCLSGPP